MIKFESIENKKNEKRRKTKSENRFCFKFYVCSVSNESDDLSQLRRFHKANFKLFCDASGLFSCLNFTVVEPQPL